MSYNNIGSFPAQMALPVVATGSRVQAESQAPFGICYSCSRGKRKMATGAIASNTSAQMCYMSFLLIFYWPEQITRQADNNGERKYTSKSRENI